MDIVQQLMQSKDGQLMLAILAAVIVLLLFHFLVEPIDVTMKAVEADWAREYNDSDVDD